MGCSASKADMTGTIAFGPWDEIIKMPTGTFAEQLPGGIMPAGKLKANTPKKLGNMLLRKGAAQLYVKFEDEIAGDCGGSSMNGWNFDKIHDKVARYKDLWQAKGITVHFNLTSWDASSSNSNENRQIEYRHWMTYTDNSVDSTFEPEFAFDPSKDYKNPATSLIPRIIKKGDKHANLGEVHEALATTDAAKLDAIFFRIDTDGSGYIDRRELRNYLHENGARRSLCHELIRFLDVDGDGKISRQEWSKVSQMPHFLRQPDRRWGRSSPNLGRASPTKELQQ